MCFGEKGFGRKNKQIHCGAHWMLYGEGHMFACEGHLTGAWPDAEDRKMKRAELIPHSV